MLLIKRIPGFLRFIKYNGIDDVSLKNAIAHIKIVRFPTYTYIFRQGSQTKEFFGIIQGRISIRVRKSSYETKLKKIIVDKNIHEIKAFSTLLILII